MEQAFSVPPPYALAIGICDSIHRDRSTGKRYILGCFSALQAIEFPAVQPTLCIYVDLTNGRGQVPVRVQIVDAVEEREPIWMVESVVDFSDPRSVAEMDFMTGNVTFPDAGEYRVQVFAAGQFVIERRLSVNRSEART
jgi:hypothetical protein